MNYILFDGSVRNQLLPFTFTRPVADIRVGILTIREKWEKGCDFPYRPYPRLLLRIAPLFQEMPGAPAF